MSYRHYFWHGAEFGDADHSGVVPERNFDEAGGLKKNLNFPKTNKTLVKFSSKLIFKIVFRPKIILILYLKVECMPTGEIWRFGSKFTRWVGYCK